MEAVVIFITAAALAEAEKIAEQLVAENLVACVNIIPQMRSIFKWQGETCRENEVLLIAKSLKSRLPAIISSVKSNHSYEVPEIIALPIIDGSADYLNWVKAEVVA